jgi:hypothetical protein
VSTKEVVWDGIVCPESLSEEASRVRQALADAAKKYDWDTVLSALDREPTLVNTTRPGQRHEITSAGSNLAAEGFV